MQDNRLNESRKVLKAELKMLKEDGTGYKKNVLWSKQIRPVGSNYANETSTISDLCSEEFSDKLLQSGFLLIKLQCSFTADISDFMGNSIPIWLKKHF